MKDMIQRMTDIENNKGKKQLKKQLKESTVAEECGMPMSSAPMEQQGNPVTMSISLNASGKEHVADLINMMKNAGLQAAGPVAADTMPMRMDMERLRGIVDEPEMDIEPEMEEADAGGFDRATTEPDEAYGDLDSAIPNGDDLHKKKKMYAKAQDGDNAMAVETIKARLLAALTEKKAKPDFLDVDKDKNKKEPFKKAVKDAKVKEGKKPDFLDMDKDGDKKEPMKKAVADKKKNPFAKKDESVKEASKEEKFDALKHVKNPTKGEKDAAKDVKRGSYGDRAAMLKSAEKDGRLKK